MWDALRADLQRSDSKDCHACLELPHCLQDLLLRQQAGEFRAEIALVISNHREAGVDCQCVWHPVQTRPITAETSFNRRPMRSR